MKGKTLEAFPKVTCKSSPRLLFLFSSFSPNKEKPLSFHRVTDKPPSSNQKWRNQTPFAHTFNHYSLSPSPSPSSPTFSSLLMLRVSPRQNSTVSYTETTHWTWTPSSSRRFSIRFAPTAETPGHLSRKPSIITALAFVSSFTSSLYR